MGPIGLAALSGAELHPLVIKQSKRSVKPGSTPPVPVKTTAGPCTHQVPLDLLLHSLFDIPKKAAGVPNPEVV